MAPVQHGPILVSILFACVNRTGHFRELHSCSDWVGCALCVAACEAWAKEFTNIRGDTKYGTSSRKTEGRTINQTQCGSINAILLFWGIGNEKYQIISTNLLFRNLENWEVEHVMFGEKAGPKSRRSV